ncbi:PE-PPE domain-containing protein [Streptomyces sp. SID6673]|nr:PE-PPE domain-containing protein [Streptomyces sp. SID11726]NEB24749.1 PE-PPE domain-containing protein [Streptomyces sp. SID6673]
MTTRFPMSRRASVALIAVCSSLAVVAAFCIPGAVGTAAAADCGGGAVVIVGGTNDPDGAAMIGIKQRYSGTGLDNTLGTGDDTEYAGAPYQVIYADYPTTLWPLGAAGYDDSVAQGEVATRSAIATYQHACGTDKPVVVAGYSQGARVAGDVLSDLGNDRDMTGVLLDEDGNPVLDENGVPVTATIDTTNITGELYADPRRDGTVAGEGIELALIGVIPGLTMTGPRDDGFGTIPVTTVCAAGDPICDLPDPLHDPIGAIDGLVGYFTKHNYYPYRMYLDPADWPTTECVADSTTTCMVPQDSAIVGVIRQGAEAIGIDGAEIPDFLAGHWTVDLPDGASLANLQPLVRLIQAQLPQLPDLGYGAYLPDLFVFEAIIDGIVHGAPDEVKAGVAALAASAKSIILAPVNYVRFLAEQIPGPQMLASAGGATVLAAGAMDDPPAENRVAVLRAVAAIEEPQGADSGAPATDSALPGPSSSATSQGNSAAADSAAGAAQAPAYTYTPPAAVADPEPSVADSGSGVENGAGVTGTDSTGTGSPRTDGTDTGGTDTGGTDTETGGTGSAGAGSAPASESAADSGGTTPGDSDTGDDRGTGPAVTSGTGGGTAKSSASSNSGDDDGE